MLLFLSLQDIYDSMEFSAVARNDVEIVNKMSKKLNAKLKKTSNIINDVCNFIETEAPKITRNSCNKFNTFVTPCPASSSSSNNIASGWQQQQQYDVKNSQVVVVAKSNPILFDPLTAAQTNFANNDNLNANHKMDILNYLNLTSGSSTTTTNNNNNNNKNTIDYNNNNGIILNQGKIIMRNSHDNNVNTNNNDDDEGEEDESEEEKNVLNNKLQNFLIKRFNDEMSRGPVFQQRRRQQLPIINMLNVKQHYFLSKYDQLTDNKCQYYFDDTHLR